MNKTIRTILAFPVCGLTWYAGLQLFFVRSGAQNILADPRVQSSKFLDAFMKEPFPRMMSDTNLPVKGMLVTGSLMAAVFVFLNDKLHANWFRKGIWFGLISWALVIPWFEFYLPYNVMREPLKLVLFEALLWLGVMLMTGIVLSFLLNFKRTDS